MMLQGEELFQHMNIIRLPEDVTISPESQAVHGISASKCKRKGVPIKLALIEFGDCMQQADIIVAHNISFDKRVILSSCRREKVPQYFFSGSNVKNEYCTMKRTKDIPVIVQIQMAKINYPTLTELHKYLFNGDSPKATHDALGDILICLRCYIKHCHGYDIVKERNALPKTYIDFAFSSN